MPATKRTFDCRPSSSFVIPCARTIDSEKVSGAGSAVGVVTSAGVVAWDGVVASVGLGSGAAEDAVRWVSELESLIALPTAPIARRTATIVRPIHQRRFVRFCSGVHPFVVVGGGGDGWEGGVDAAWVGYATCCHARPSQYLKEFEPSGFGYHPGVVMGMR